eukprot:CAMPEP_0113315662 /NCGR_PEP_ID=MMETSP0010_2-20120614/11243_1 /TAXON_ID=216773 ORGANISM="Corethron hystrix, Strain 308" /NCGR_SAMPLE_ID=MMETSP0010_2 /ASSEMBLY_ACC=CAM_ASM_000155 /LENGTH=182 /DNA_ID=CAMNT_0000172213 /DNA_START=102 /DNA_END=649 /DNA_ORIENTATION=+ /assembly_acc=CAM_ASM_000155
MITSTSFSPTPPPPPLSELEVCPSVSEVIDLLLFPDAAAAALSELEVCPSVSEVAVGNDPAENMAAKNNLWWCRFRECLNRHHHKLILRRHILRRAEDRTAAVLREQFRLRTAGSVDPGQLAQVARWHSKYVNLVDSVAVLRAPLTSRILRRFFCRPDRDCARRAGMEDAQVARAIGSLTAA